MAAALVKLILPDGTTDSYSYFNVDLKNTMITDDHKLLCIVDGVGDKKRTTIFNMKYVYKFECEFDKEELNGAEI